MNLADYTFVALDLETTGLEPRKDTIIEVAAVRFRLKKEGERFIAIDQEERSMLIDPLRKLEDNIAMITGISDSMLKGRKKWGEVREKIQEFIGESIIVGHNVLFDVNMLETHGIDLGNHTILDTFELSEIFSQDAESLNLGFLGKKYKFNMESEHRALDDTRLSIDLFCQYLSEVGLLDENLQNLWKYLIPRDHSRVIESLLDITSLSGESSGFHLPFEFTKNESTGRELRDHTEYHHSAYTIISLSGSKEEEKKMIETALRDGKRLFVLSQNKEQSHFFGRFLETIGQSYRITKASSDFCSIEMIQYWLKKESLKRKESIFLLKMIHWLHSTDTGLLDELKYYGEERVLLKLFRKKDDEENTFTKRYQKEIDKSTILLSDVSSYDANKRESGDFTYIVRDLGLMEDTLRRKESQSLSFGEIDIICDLLKTSVYHGISWDKIKDITSMIGEVFMRIPGTSKESTEMRGEYEETYFINQESLWNRGGKWLILMIKKLEKERQKLDTLDISDLVERHTLEILKRLIDSLISISLSRKDNISIIMSVKEGVQSLAFIPRSMKISGEYFIKNLNPQNTILLGYGIENAIVRKFIQDECGIGGDIQSLAEEEKVLRFPLDYRIEEDRAIILTTSMRHIRELASKYKNMGYGKNIYAQGLSGGKGKMLSLFRSSKEKTLFIGLLDSWMDDREIWEIGERVIIMKIPFDPPTDPYFLARTVGMKNNFEEYSNPIALIKINTLIGRIHFSNPKSRVDCFDERISTTNWGREMKEKFL